MSRRRLGSIAPITILLAMLFDGGCAGNRKVTEISLERKGCLGPCPVYKVTLLADGSAIYVGKKNAYRIGTFANDEFWPIADEFARLADAIDRAGFSGLAGQYSPGWLDAEVVVTTVTRNGKAKVITTQR